MSASVSLLFLTSLCLLAVACTLSRAEQIMDYEPVEHLKTHLPKKGDDISRKLDEFLKTPEQELKRKTEQMEKNLKKLLKKKTHVSVALLRESEILARRIPSNLRFNSTFFLPHGVLLPILSTTLPILLENYKRELVFEPMGKILKEKHRSHEHVKDYLSLSLFDLVTRLPRTGDSVDLEGQDLLSKLNQRGRAAFYYVSTVLDTVAEDAWKDALISVAMERSAFSEDGHMLTSLQDLSHYSDMLAVDLVNFYEAPQSDVYPLDAGHFLFGWWFNCPGGSKDKATKCLAPHMPSGTVAILNPVVRIYCIPSLTVSLVIANFEGTPGRQSVSDVIREDKAIWKQIYSVVDPASAQETKEEGKKVESSEVPAEEEASPADGVSEEAMEKEQESEPEKEPGKTERAEKEPSVPPTAEPEEVGSEDQSKDKTLAAPPESTAAPTESTVEEEDEVLGETPDTVTVKATREAGDSPSAEPVAAQDDSTEDDVMGEGETQGETQEERKGEKEDSPLTRAIYVGWPVAVFLFYTIFSHVWVYWIAHLLWITASSIFPGVHLPRPKTSKQD